jgi:digeranylgeranylglycerophospholipid reductase
LEEIEHYDAVIIGSGPAGSSAARVIANGGYNTLIVERKPKVGIPVLCGEFLPTETELKDILPNSNRIEKVCNIPKSMVVNQCRRIVLVSPSGHEYELPMRASVIDRMAFDQYLAERAVDAGADLLSRTRFEKRVGKNRVRLVSGNKSKIVKYAVLVGADGALSTVARNVPGLSQLERNSLSKSIQYTIEGNGFPSDRVFMFFGNMAPGGYAWVIPRGPTEANVGLGLRPAYADSGKSLRAYLHSFMHTSLFERIGIRDLRVKRRISAHIPVRGPVRNTVTSDALLVGDAASHVMPTNGGGIPTALIGGDIAGEAIMNHFETGAKLANYEKMWRSEFGRELTMSASLLLMASIPMLSAGLTEWAMSFFGERMLNDVIRCRVPYPFQHVTRPINFMTDILKGLP